MYLTKMFFFLVLVLVFSLILAIITLLSINISNTILVCIHLCRQKKEHWKEPLFGGSHIGRDILSCSFGISISERQMVYCVQRRQKIKKIKNP